MSDQEKLSKVILLMQQWGYLQDMDAYNTSELTDQECNRAFLRIHYHIKQLSCFQ